jgi:hypothetical protein
MPAPVANAYAPCLQNQMCASISGNATSCQQANRMSGSVAGLFCSSVCTRIAQTCPGDQTNSNIICVTDPGNTNGICYMSCPTGVCPAGLTCLHDTSGTVTYCAP